MTPQEYIEKNFQESVDTLVALLKIPSISAQSTHKQDTRKCAEYLVDHLKKLGLSPRLYETPGHPIIYAEYLGNSKAPTALIYGHYDVQPVDPLDRWTSPPFEPRLKNNIIYARGSCDDKGQLLIHLKAIEAFLKTEGKVPINFKLVLEGEEEAQSTNLDDFLKKEQAMLKCDLTIVSDTAMFGRDKPALTYGLRGIAAAEIKVIGPDRDVHSGSYGGAIPNPVHALCQIIAACHDDKYRITIPGFYDDVLPLEAWEKEEIGRLPFDDQAFLKETGCQGLVGEAGFSTLERKWARPTFEINGIFGGYEGEGGKTIVPSWAGAKITMRLVANQAPQKIGSLLEQYLRQIKPEGVKLEVKISGGAKPALVSKNNPIMQAASRALKAGFGVDPYFIREGGSIPIVNVFKEVLGADTILFGFGQPDCNAHGPDEWFDLGDFKRGMIAAVHLYKILAETKV